MDGGLSITNLSFNGHCHMEVVSKQSSMSDRLSNLPCDRKIGTGLTIPMIDRKGIYMPVDHR